MKEWFKGRIIAAFFPSGSLVLVTCGVKTNWKFFNWSSWTQASHLLQWEVSLHKTSGLCPSEPFDCFPLINQKTEAWSEYHVSKEWMSIISYSFPEIRGINPAVQSHTPLEVFSITWHHWRWRPWLSERATAGIMFSPCLSTRYWH